VISLKNKFTKRSALVFGLFIVTSFLFMINSSHTVLGGSEFISSVNDMETFVVEDLENGKIYEFSITYDSGYHDFDIGFAIYTNGNFKDKNLVLTQDDPGFGFEVANYTASNDGDFYLGVWINDDEYGFVTITVTEQGTAIDKTVENYYPSLFSSLRWIWIMLGVMVGVVIIAGVLIGILVMRAAKKHRARVAAARERGEALPRYGRKKNKCPFCNVKLPPKSMVTCPYCGAPITNE